MKIDKKTLAFIIIIFIMLCVALVYLSKYKNTKETFQSGSVRHIRHVYPSNAVVGMGDFIRGSFVLAKFCKQNGLQFDIDYSEHPIHKYLINNNVTPDIQTNKTNMFKADGILQPKDLYSKLSELMKSSSSDILFVNTANAYVEYPIDEDIRTFIRNSFLPNMEIKEGVQNIQSQLLGSHKEYNVIHARLGDAALNSGTSPESQYSNIQKEINTQLNNVDSSLPMLVISDDAKFKEFMRESAKVIPVPTKPAHTILSNDLKDTMVDFFLLCNAKAIIQYSTYWWGSGFSDRAADMYKISIYKTKESSYT